VTFQVLHHTVLILYCIMLYCTHTVLYSYCTASCCAVLILYSVPYCTASYCAVLSYYTQYHTVLYCIILCCALILYSVPYCTHTVLFYFNHTDLLVRELSAPRW
jgi:hypothetical protein